MTENHSISNRPTSFTSPFHSPFRTNSDSHSDCPPHSSPQSPPSPMSPLEPGEIPNDALYNDAEWKFTQACHNSSLIQSIDIPASQEDVLPNTNSMGMQANDTPQVQESMAANPLYLQSSDDQSIQSIEFSPIKFLPMLRSSFLILKEPYTIIEAVLEEIHFHSQFCRESFDMKSFIRFLKRAYKQNDEFLFVYLDNTVNEGTVQRVANELWEYCCTSHIADTNQFSIGDSDTQLNPRFTRRYVLLCVDVLDEKRQNWLRNEFLYSKNTSMQTEYGLFVCGFKEMNGDVLQQFFTSFLSVDTSIDSSLKVLEQIIWRSSLRGKSISGVTIVSDEQNEHLLNQFVHWMQKKKLKILEDDYIQNQYSLKKKALKDSDLNDIIIPIDIINTFFDEKNVDIVDLVDVPQSNLDSPPTNSQRANSAFLEQYNYHSIVTRHSYGPQLQIPMDQRKVKAEVKNKLINATRVTCISLKSNAGSTSHSIVTSLMNDLDIKQRFTDGIYRIVCGKFTRPIEILFQMRKLCAMIDVSKLPSMYSIPSGNVILSQLLKGKNVLIILNDVYCFEQLSAFHLAEESGVKYLITTSCGNILDEYPKTRIHDSFEFILPRLTMDECLELLPEDKIAPDFNPTELLGFFQGHYYAIVIISSLLQMGDLPSNILDFLETHSNDIDLEDGDSQVQRTFLLFQYILETHIAHQRQHLLTLSAFPEDVELPISILSLVWGDSLNASIDRVQLFSAYHLVEIVNDVQHIFIRTPSIVHLWLKNFTKSTQVDYHKKILDSFSIFCPRYSGNVDNRSMEEISKPFCSPLAIQSRKQDIPKLSLDSKVNIQLTPQSARENRYEYTCTLGSPRSISSLNDSSPRRGVINQSSPRVGSPIRSSSSSTHRFQNLQSPRDHINARNNLESPNSPSNISSQKFSPSSKSSLSPKNHSTLQKSVARRGIRKREMIMWQNIHLTTTIDTPSLVYDYFYKFLTYHLVCIGQFESIRRLLLDYRWVFQKVEIVQEVGEVLVDFERLYQVGEYGTFHLQSHIIHFMLFPSHIATLYQALRDSLPILVINRKELGFQLLGRLIHLRGSIRSYLHGIIEFHKNRGENWIYPFVPYSTGCRPSGRAILLNTIDLSRSVVGSLNSLKVTPDSNSIIFLGRDSQAHIFHISTSQQVRELPINADWNFDITPCGRYIIAHSYDRVLRKFDIETGVEVLSFVQESCKLISFLLVSPNGKYVLIYSAKRIIIWLVEKGTVHRIIDLDFKLTAIAWDYSCCHLFIASDSANITRIRSSTGQEDTFYPLPFEKKQFSTWVSNFAVNRQYLYSAFPYDNVITEHSIKSGKCLKVIQCFSPYSLSLAGKFIVVGSQFGDLQVRNLNTEKKIAECTLFDGESVLVQVTPDEQHIIAYPSPSQRATKIIKILDLRTLASTRSMETQLSQHDEDTKEVAISRIFFKGNAIIPLTNDNYIIPHKLDSGRELDVWKIGYGTKAVAPDVSFIVVLACTPSNAMVSSSLEIASSNIEIWNLRDLGDVPNQTYHFTNITKVRVCTSNNLILFQYSTNRILIINSQSGHLLHAIENDFPVLEIYTNSLNDFLIIVYVNGILRIYNLQPPFDCKCEIKTDLTHSIKDIQLINHKNLYIATGSYVQYWEIEEPSHSGDRVTDSNFQVSAVCQSDGIETANLSLQPLYQSYAPTKSFQFENTTVSSQYLQNANSTLSVSIPQPNITATLPRALSLVASKFQLPNSFPSTSQSSRSKPFYQSYKTQSPSSPSTDKILNVDLPENDEKDIQKWSCTHIHTYCDIANNDEIVCIAVHQLGGLLCCGTLNNTLLFYRLDDIESIKQVIHLSSTPNSLTIAMPHIVVGDVEGNVTFLKYMELED